MTTTTETDYTKRDAERAGISVKALRRIDAATITKAGRELAARIEAPNERTACRLLKLCSLLSRAGARAFTLAEEGCNGSPMMDYYERQAWNYAADDPRRAEMRAKANKAQFQWEQDHEKRDAANDARLTELVAILAALSGQPWRWAQESLGVVIYRADADREAMTYRATSSAHFNGESLPAIWISGQ